MKLIGTNANVFSLDLMYSNLRGYYITRDGVIWSTRQGKPNLLSGSKTISGHYYTLNGTTWRAEEILRRARQHSKFLKETDPGEVVDAFAEDRKNVTVLSKNSPSYLIDQGIRDHGYVIATATDKGLLFGSQPKIHLTLEEAKTEAMRLATVSPGTKFVYLQIRGAVQSQGLVWS